MQILKLDISHKDKITDLFSHDKLMGVEVEGNWSQRDAESHSRFVQDVWEKTYLTNLNNFHAYGLFDDDDNLQCIISLYDSSDEPSWYYTMCRSRGDIKVVKKLLDHVIEVQEKKNRFKFYTLVNVKHAPLLRKFTYSEYNNERYGYYDEFIVPAKTRCYYNNAWELLFKKFLLPVDSIVRCSFLKQEYRSEIPIAGNI
jgi:hypothetical protein